MRLSVITINYNDRAKLERTIDSVETQEFRDFEYIVVDGNSTDGSAGILEKQRSGISKSIVESDLGPFDAMNKGAALAEGDYLLFLNAGDSFAASNSLSKVFASLQGKDLYYCDAIFARGERRWLQTYPNEVDLERALVDPLNHQNVFLRREFFLAQGGYRTDFQIVSDWAFMVKAIHDGSPSMEHLAETVAVYHVDGRSSLKANGSRILEEKKRFLEELSAASGKVLYNYVEYRDTEYGKIRARFRKRSLFDSIMMPSIMLSKALARMGF